MSRVSAVLLLLAVGAHAFGRFGGTTTTYTGEGWCFSELDFEIEGVATPELCWETCLDNYGDDLVAIDWYEGYCYCQDDCTCMQDAPPGVVAITRDSAVDALPDVCEDEDHGGTRMLAGAPSFEEYRKSHKERKSHK